MDLPERNEITELMPVRDFAKLAGIPYRTLYRWLEKRAPSGKGAARIWRLEAVNTALVKAKAMKALERERAQ